MTARRLPPDGLPDWPRWLSVKLAAAYVDASETAFREEIKAGLWPDRNPKTRRWDRALLDEASNRLSNPSQGPAKAPDITGRFERWGKSA